jgi:hypothetical protein
VYDAIPLCHMSKSAVVGFKRGEKYTFIKSTKSTIDKFFELYSENYEAWHNHFENRVKIREYNLKKKV